MPARPFVRNGETLIKTAECRQKWSLLVLFDPLLDQFNAKTARYALPASTAMATAACMARPYRDEAWPYRDEAWTQY